jgi:hypothetical protein
MEPDAQRKVYMAAALAAWNAGNARRALVILEALRRAELGEGWVYWPGAPFAA